MRVNERIEFVRFNYIFRNRFMSIKFIQFHQNVIFHSLAAAAVAQRKGRTVIIFMQYILLLFGIVVSLSLSVCCVRITVNIDLSTIFLCSPQMKTMCHPNRK